MITTKQAFSEWQENKYNQLSEEDKAKYDQMVEDEVEQAMLEEEEDNF